MSEPATNDGRGVRAPAELRSMRDLMATLARYAPMILGITLLVALAVGLGAKATERAPRAKARLVLTNSVVWPYYDAVRDEQRAVLADQATFDEVAARIRDAGTLEALSASTPTGQVFIDVEATASSPAAAVAAANAAASVLVERNRAQTVGKLEAARDAAQRDLAAIEKTVQDLTAQVDALEPRISELTATVATSTPSAALRLELRQLENQRTGLIDRRNIENARRNPAARTLDETVVALRGATPQIDLVRPATRGSTDPDRTRSIIFLAAIAALLLATGAAVVHDSSSARIRSRRHAIVGGGRALPIVSARDLATDRAYANRLLELRHGREVIGVAAAVTGDEVADRTVRAVADTLARTHTRVVTFGPGAAAGPSTPRISLTDALGESPEHLALAVTALADRLARQPHVHVDTDRYLQADADVDSAARLRAFIDGVAATADVVLVDCGVADDHDAPWQGLAGTCDVLVIAATTGRTRQHELRRAAQLAWERPARQVAVSLDVPSGTTKDNAGVTR